MSKCVFLVVHSNNNIQIDISNANDLLSLFIWFDFIFSKLHGDRKLHLNLNTLEAYTRKRIRMYGNIILYTYYILTRGEFCVIWTLVWFRSNQTRIEPLTCRTNRSEKKKKNRAKMNQEIKCLLWLVDNFNDFQSNFFFFYCNRWLIH